MKQHEIGTKIVFTSGSYRDVTLGDVYTIVGVDSDGDEFFIDDAGDPNYAAASGVIGLGVGNGHGNYTIVTE